MVVMLNMTDLIAYFMAPTFIFQLHHLLFPTHTSCTYALLMPFVLPIYSHSISENSLLQFSSIKPVVITPIAATPLTFIISSHYTLSLLNLSLSL